MTAYTSRGLADGTTARASSAVSWSDVLGGAVVSASISLMLLAAGAGLGFTSISPWSNAGVAATTFGIAALVWLALVHLVAAGAGGYLAGRLRTRRVGLHTDEVAFRDSAHGFMTWAVSVIVTVEKDMRNDALAHPRQEGRICSPDQDVDCRMTKRRISHFTGEPATYCRRRR